MGLRFYFGASGAGKSTQLHNEMVRRSMEEPKTNFLVIVYDADTDGSGEGSSKEGDYEY